jgi:GAF domain-containing protein
VAQNDKSIPSSLGTEIPIDVEKLSERFDITKPIAINDIAEAKDATLKFFAKALETKSLLIVPISLNGKVSGLLGLHDTNAPREWFDEEIQFLESIARQLAIGYQYTSLYVAQEQETARRPRRARRARPRRRADLRAARPRLERGRARVSTNTRPRSSKASPTNSARRWSATNSRRK